MSQRLVPLEIRAKDGGADLVAPPNANVAPPGFYMLFALKDGKPSVAHWIYLGADTAPAATPTSNRPVPAPAMEPEAPGGESGAPGGGTAPAPAPAAPTPPSTTPTPTNPTTPGTPGAPPAPAADRSAPTPRLRLATTARQVGRTARLPLRLTLGEAGTVTVTARLALSPRTRTIRIPRRGTQRIRFTRAGTRTLTLRLAAGDARRIRRGRTVLRVSLRATDAAGNVRSRTISLRL
jgi:hypothetical protein